MLFNHILERSSVVRVLEVHFYFVLSSTAQRGSYGVAIFIMLEEVVAESKQMLMEESLSSAD